MAAAAEKYDMTVYPVQVAVRSASDGARVHMVTLPYCDCPDFTNRRGRVTEDGTVSVCKHIREALERVGGWHRSEPEPEVYGNLTRERAREILGGIEGLNYGMVDHALTAVHSGSPHFLVPLTRTATVELRVSAAPRRYTITIPADGPARPAPEQTYVTHRDVSQQRARTLLTEAGLTLPEAKATLLAADGHRGLAAEASPGNGTAARVTTYDAGRYEVSVPA